MRPTWCAALWPLPPDSHAQVPGAVQLPWSYAGEHTELGGGAARMRGCGTTCAIDLHYWQVPHHVDRVDADACGLLSSPYAANMQPREATHCRQTWSCLGVHRPGPREPVCSSLGGAQRSPSDATRTAPTAARAY